MKQDTDDRARAQARTVGGQAALDAAVAQSHCSGDLPSDYLLDALHAAIAAETERARNDERVALLHMLGADTMGMAFATRDDVKTHVLWLESRAKLMGRRPGRGEASS